jgi:tetratricopeptide (TPR) repeat protein
MRAAAAFTATLTLLAPGMAQMPLAEVAKLARARAERSLPGQQQAMQPFWADLSLDYRINQQMLDPRIDQVAALGDGIVPLLLERLQPAQGGEMSRNLAGNCRRVLEKLDPASFVDALAEIANGGNEIGRTEAIRLLGLANVPQSGMVLGELLDRLNGEDKRLCVRSLRQLKASEPAVKVALMLASNDRQMREEVLTYLIAARPPQVVELALQALGTERDNNLLRSYIDYFAAAVTGHDGAARGLLSLLEGDRLDWADRKRLIGALATVAPAGHDPTTKRLLGLIDEGEATSLTVQAAVTLRALGEKQGVARAKRIIDDSMRKPNRRRDPQLLEIRGSLLFATEDYGEALADFERMLEAIGPISEGQTLQRRSYIWQMRCEARRKRVPNLTKLMKTSGLTAAEIEAIGAEDPVFAEALQDDKVKQALQSLGKVGK